MTHRTTFLFGFLFSLMLLPAILRAQTCDTLGNALATDTPSLFSTDSGFVSGHNEFGDIAKADRFTGTGSVTSALVLFGAATSASSSSAVQVRVWDNDGPGGAPGTVLTSESVTIQSIANSIDTNTNIARVVVNFSTPAQVNGIFYVGISFIYTPGDVVGLITTSDLTRAGTAWEQWGDQTWHAYSDTLGWGSNLSHYIFAAVCGSVGVETVDGGNVMVSAAPNPFTAQTTISVEGITGNYDFQLIDAIGKTVKELRALDTPRFTLTRDNLPAGMYLYTVSTPKGMVRGSLMVR